MPDYRLGDLIDDHCSRCSRVTDHSVVVMYGGEVLKTRCRTCDFEHGYRHAKGGKKKQKPSAFEQVLASMNPPPAQAAPRPADGEVGSKKPETHPAPGRGKSPRP